MKRIPTIWSSCKERSATGLQSQHGDCNCAWLTSRNVRHFLPLLGDHGSRSERLNLGTQFVAGLGSHWAGVREGKYLFLALVAGSLISSVFAQDRLPHY